MWGVGRNQVSKGTPGGKIEGKSEHGRVSEGATSRISLKESAPSFLGRGGHRRGRNHEEEVMDLKKNRRATFWRLLKGKAQGREEYSDRDSLFANCKKKKIYEKQKKKRRK